MGAVGPTRPPAISPSLLVMADFMRDAGFSATEIEAEMRESGGAERLRAAVRARRPRLVVDNSEKDADS